MTKSPVRIIIAVLLILGLGKVLLGTLINLINGNIDLSSGEAIGETIGQFIGYALVGVIIFLLLKDWRKKAGN